MKRRVLMALAIFTSLAIASYIWHWVGEFIRVLGRMS